MPDGEDYDHDEDFLGNEIETPCMSKCNSN